MTHRLLYLCGLVLASFLLVACGSSGAGQDELEQARTEGAKEAEQQTKIERIEHQLKSLKHRHGSPWNQSNSEANPPAPVSSSTSCGGSLSVGPNTTCAFAENVEYAYYAEISGGSGTVSAYSPVTGRLYTMYCTGGEPHECTGGNSASVFFP